MPAEGRGLSSRSAYDVAQDLEIGMGLRTPPTVQKLQTTLHAKAKGAPSFRFYALYDKVYRSDVLAHAYALCRANRGAAGVDGQTFGAIEASGVECWLGVLTAQLKEKAYCPQAVRRVWVPKPNGTQRPLGIPTIRDRVVQQALLLVIEPIFEADLLSEQYAYRRGRSALDAVQAVHRLVNTGHTEVVDADLSGYFDSIPHGPLMKCLARRVSDGAVLRLVKLWLEAPVEETDERGRARRTTRNRDSRRGPPQGAPISPLLSNIYMRRFVLGWKTLGHEGRLDAHLVNYADDFVLCCRGTAAEADRAMRDILARIGLTLNDAKTCIRRLPDESVDFLGYTIGRCHSPATGRAYLGTRPATTRVQRVCRRVSELTRRNTLWRDVGEVVGDLNRLLGGWANYFRLGPVSRAYRAVDAHVVHRLRRWLCLKHKQVGRGTARYPDEALRETLGLIHLSVRTRSLPWANA